MSLDKWIIICIHHYGVIKSILIVLEILCSLPVFPPSNLLATTDFFSYRLHNSAFSKVPYTWKCTVCTLSDWLLSLSTMRLSFLHVFSWLNRSFLFKQHIFWICHSSFIYSPLGGKFGCFWVLIIMNKAALDIHKQVLAWYKFSTPLVKHWGVWLQIMWWEYV